MFDRAREFCRLSSLRGLPDLGGLARLPRLRRYEIIQRSAAAARRFLAGIVAANPAADLARDSAATGNTGCGIADRGLFCLKNFLPKI